MCKAQCGWNSRRLATLAGTLLALFTVVAWHVPALATIKYGNIELSGNFETQNLARHQEVNKWQFIQNRNTMRLRVDWDWLQKGRLIDKINVPFIESSKLFILYRGVYDGFYDIAPKDNQLGQERFDDLVGGPVMGNDVGACVGGPCPGAFGNNGANGAPLVQRPLQPGLYSRFNGQDRSGIKFENTLREAYVDMKLAKLPVSLRIGRQQVIWGESDQFRLMDIWNPLDVTWHLQQESGGGAGGGGGSWDNIRIPLWLVKGLWNIGDIGPFSNTFLETVYNPFDFQPNQKFAFLPRPWGVFLPDPLRPGQVQQVLPGAYISPVFDLQGSTFRHGTFKRDPQDASEIGARIHASTPQGIEFTLNYLYARGRGVGAASPLGVKISHIGSPRPPSATSPQRFQLEDKSFSVSNLPVTAEIKYPYNHIFGVTGNYFEGDYTGTVFRLESAYVLDEPVQSTDPSVTNLGPGNFAAAPQNMDKRNVWAGMVGFDRPTWIRFLNPKATWFISGQFFWSYYDGSVAKLVGNSGASESPYFTPAAGQPGHNSQGLGQWISGPNAGLVERLQNAAPGTPPSGDAIRHWEHLITLAGTSFYKGGTMVPFVATAIDPVNANAEFLWNFDYFYSNDIIITLQQKFFTDFGSNVPSDDPWGAGGRLHRRDESGVKITYQF
jgi:uncharacterized protein DUF1302